MRVLLMDSEEIYLRGLEAVLEARAGLHFESMLLRAGSAPPEPSGRFDIVIVGVTHRGWRDLQPLFLTTRSLSDRSLALVSDCARSQITEILRADFDSLVHRSAAASTLNRAIFHTLRTHHYVDELIGAWLLTEAGSRWSAFSLTAREREIADLLMTDLTLVGIAGRLRISHNTVKYHVASIYRKVGVKSRRGLQEVGGPPG